MTFLRQKNIPGVLFTPKRGQVLQCVNRDNMISIAIHALVLVLSESKNFNNWINILRLGSV